MEQKTVLIIDDDPAIRETFQEVLEIEGYQVWSASNGKEGLALLNKIPPPGLILLDLIMPIMDGWEFLKAFTPNEKLARIPVVMMTSFSGKSAKTAQGVLRKPLDLSQLIHTVQQYCVLQ